MWQIAQTWKFWFIVYINTRVKMCRKKTFTDWNPRCINSCFTALLSEAQLTLYLNLERTNLLDINYDNQAIFANQIIQCFTPTWVHWKTKKNVHNFATAHFLHFEWSLATKHSSFQRTIVQKKNSGLHV